MLLHRISYCLYKYHLKFLCIFLEFFIFLIYNSRIPSNVELGKGTFFAYRGMSVLLVKGTKFGKSCCIGPRVTTGRKFPFKNVPTFGDNVWIGPNSVIIGPVKVGDNVIILPNSFLDKSVPDFAIIAGNPAKIIGDSRNLGFNIFSNPQNVDGYAPFI